MVRLLIIIITMILVCEFSRYFADEKKDVAATICIIIYSLFVGLRTGYNDTATYIKSFNAAVPLAEFLQNEESMNILHNPLFYAINSKFHEITNNYHIFFMVVAILNAVLLIRFIQKHSYGHFGYAILLFWGFGLGMFGAAAMKQITAMALLTIAFDAVIDKKWLKFIIIVLLASLIHTYAIMFIILPIFTSRPWNWKTAIVIAGTGAVLLTFNTTIASLLDYADAAGKSVADFEVFDGVQMNIFRVGVYAICPIALFIFRKRLFDFYHSGDRTFYLLSNMSIISFMFTLLASVNGANMFGRLATYFVLGDICLLGEIIDRIFVRKSSNFVRVVSFILFIAFIMYDNTGIDAYGGYTCISLWQLITGVI